MQQAAPTAADPRRSRRRVGRSRVTGATTGVAALAAQARGRTDQRAVGVSIDEYRSRSGVDDDDLLAAVRAGDRDAYGELYARHAPSARRFARSLLTNEPDADDAVAEVFARLLQAIERGRGPDHTFAAYLFASLRHECVRIERRRAREGADPAVGGPSRPRGATGDHAAGVAEAAVVRAAFASLPGEMRDILRLTEVDQLPPLEIATRLAEDPGTVATRAMRARRALGSAYLRQHIGIGGHRHQLGDGCGDTQAHIASFLRGTAGSRRRARIEEHLATCAACRAECADLRQINGHLRSVAFAILAAMRTAGEAAWSHVAAAAVASAAPLAATGVITATALAPVVIVPPAGREPAAPAVVEEVSLPPALGADVHLPMGLAAESVHPPVAADPGADAPVLPMDIVRSVDERPSTVPRPAPAAQVIVEDVTMPPPAPVVAAPEADPAAPPAAAADSAGSPSSDGGSSTGATADVATVAAATPAAEPAGVAVVAVPTSPPPTSPPTTPPPPPATTIAPAPQVPVTDPPVLAAPTRDDGGAPTTVPRTKGGPGKAVPTDDEGGDPGKTGVIPAGRVPINIVRPVDAP